MAQFTERFGTSVFEPTHIKEIPWEERKEIIPSYLFLKEKWKPNGEFDKLKATLVAGGNMQNEELYPNKSSPTVSTDSIILFSALAACNGLAVASIDFPAAFLTCDIPRDMPAVHVRAGKFLSDVLCRIDARYQYAVQTLKKRHHDCAPE
mmetsp:Transcript_12222/g.26739  ORF Transcript_12222/g.26739 Transcript_12222/m.26739 type:complete len:150 (+) Transcript_12222:465-914(+)